MCHRGVVLKARGRDLTTDCSDGYRVSYCVVRMEYGLWKRDERQVYMGLDRESCHQSMYWDRARAMGARASEGGCGYEDEHGAGRRKHQLGPEAEVILPRRARGIYVATWGLNKVPSHLFHPLGFRVCPVFVCRPKWVLVGSWCVCAAP